MRDMTQDEGRELLVAVRRWAAQGPCTAYLTDPSRALWDLLERLDKQLNAPPMEQGSGTRCCFHCTHRLDDSPSLNYCRRYLRDVGGMQACSGWQGPVHNLGGGHDVVRISAHERNKLAGAAFGYGRKS